MKTNDLNTGEVISSPDDLISSCYCSYQPKNGKEFMDTVGTETINYVSFIIRWNRKLLDSNGMPVDSKNYYILYRKNKFDIKYIYPLAGNEFMRLEAEQRGESNV